MLPSAARWIRSSGVFRSEKHSSAVLLGAALLGLVGANSPLGPALLDLKNTHLAIEPLALDLSFGHWVADLLLAVFFFLVAVELKYEFTKGQLSTVRKAMVPATAAVFGVLAPAGLYLLLSGSGELARGWPIPTATDIAFALGVLAVFGASLPGRMRVYLLALAVLDDLIGILIIALVFPHGFDLGALAAAAVSLAVFAAAGRLLLPRHQALAVPVLVAIALVTWYFTQQSGIHPTVAAVALGLALPSTPALAAAHHILPWSNSLVLPVFAFTAALVVIPSRGEIGPVFLALALALPLGKTIGITIGGLLGALLLHSDDRGQVRGWDLVAIAMTGGLGFTVALLMNQLAFEGIPSVADQGVLGVLAGSGISLVLGGALLAWRSRVHRRRGLNAAEEAEQPHDGAFEPVVADHPAQGTTGAPGTHAR